MVESGPSLSLLALEIVRVHRMPRSTLIAVLVVPKAIGIRTQSVPRTKALLLGHLRRTVCLTKSDMLLALFIMNKEQFLFMISKNKNMVRSFQLA